MSSGRVHYEVFGRAKPGSGWTLEMATENRALAVETAEDLVQNVGFSACKVIKETLDEDSGEFDAVTVLRLGAAETTQPRTAPKVEPACVSPSDLYTLHARERIGQVLEGWLAQVGATPFELLHRADLAEQLEASDDVLGHAIQKVAVPEAMARGASTHALIRAFQGLAERTIGRLLRKARAGALPDLEQERFADVAERLIGNPEAVFLLGAGVAGQLARAPDWAGKVSRLLDLADQAPADGRARKLAFAVLEQPLAEIIGAKTAIAALLGDNLDLGAELGALTRLTAPETVGRLAKREPLIARLIPEISPEAERLGRYMAAESFLELRTALGKRILRELNGPRRLRPEDAAGEIVILRGLAMCLTAAAGRLLPPEDVQDAFSKRSKMLVTGDFVTAYLGKGRSACEEAFALVWLAENVIGSANKRQAARWLGGVIGALRFETEMRTREQTPALRLGKLADLQRQIGRCGLAMEDAGKMQERLGEIGGKVEAEINLAASINRTNAPALQRLNILLRLASGVSAPLGPAAQRARSEALRLLRQPETRAELAAAPDQAPAVADLMKKAGLAA